MKFNELFPIKLFERHRHVPVDPPDQVAFKFDHEDDDRDKKNEEAQPLAAKIKRDCENFLTLAKGHLMYRGVDRGSGMAYFKNKIRTDRASKDSSRALTDALNNGFEAMGFKSNRTNSLFCSGSSAQASGYGVRVFVIFPVGEFNFLWSQDVEDAYSHYHGGYKQSGESSAYSDAYYEWERDHEHYEELETEWNDYDDAASEYENDRAEWEAELEAAKEAEDEAAIEEIESRQPTEPDEPDEGRMDEPSEPDRSDFDDDESDEYDEYAIASDVERSYKENDDLVKAIKSHHEIMISGQWYYAVEQQFYFDAVADFMGKPAEQKPKRWGHGDWQQHDLNV